MGLLSKLLGLNSQRNKKATPAARPRAAPAPSPTREILPSLGRSDDGAFVDGKPTFHWSEHGKDDLPLMLRCCGAELAAMKRTKLSPASFYFERAAVLLRQVGNYEGEIAICERYFEALDRHYADPRTKLHADVRKGPKYLVMVKRRDRACELLTRPAAAPGEKRDTPGRKRSTGNGSA